MRKTRLMIGSLLILVWALVGCGPKVSDAEKNTPPPPSANSPTHYVPPPTNANGGGAPPSATR